MSDRRYDVVLFGATGFTGRLVAEYLAGRIGARGGRWAIAGRSQARLEAVRRDLAKIDPKLAELAIEVADGHDAAALAALVPKTRVVCTTVGPFSRHGRMLARACAEHGTHYCDITGEVPFVRWSIDANDARAKETGARIVHCCGFDSIPFDLGVHMLWDRAEQSGAGLAWVKAFAGETKGTFSGGTVASMLNLFDEAKRDPKLWRVLGNPYALDPDPKRRGPDSGDQRGVRFDRDLGRWTGPFVMAAVNTRVVRRSSALLGYGEGFRYQESMSFQRGPKGLVAATLVTLGLGGFVAAAAVGPLRSLMSKTILPKPGEGPSREARDAGYFKVRLLGETNGPSPVRLVGRVEGTSDPGYGETAKMLGESALCLAEDGASLPPRAGVLTPASAMGMRLVSRLRDAGMTFEVSKG